MSSRPRLGIIGLGDFGREHLDGVLDSGAFDVVAVADPGREHVAAIADAHGIPHRFDDGFALIAQADVDAVAVVSPAATHLPLTAAAVHGGVAVLLEKPVVADSVEVARLVELDAQGTIVPAHILRSGHAHADARRRIVDGGLRIGGLSARRHRGIDHLARFPDQDPVFMSMVHDIDLAIWFTGSRAVSVRARGHAVRDGERLDTVLATVVDAEGRTWDLGSSWTVEVAGPADRFELYTDRGLHVLEGTALDPHEAMRAQYVRFAEALAGAPSVVSVADAVHGIAIAEAIVASVRRGGAEVEVVGASVRQTADTAR